MFTMEVYGQHIGTQTFIVKWFRVNDFPNTALQTDGDVNIFLFYIFLFKHTQNSQLHTSLWEIRQTERQSIRCSFRKAASF